VTPIIGGSPHGRGDALVDVRRAVLLDDLHVVLVDTLNKDGGTRVIGLQLSGRINKSRTRSSLLYLFDEDGAAALIAELLGLAGRADFLPELLGRLEALQAAGDLEP
jgi:hypothetical protein